jgi:hypothetical protein
MKVYSRPVLRRLGRVEDVTLNTQQPTGPDAQIYADDPYGPV